MKLWRHVVSLVRQRRGEITIKDNLLTIENGGKDSREYKERQRLVSAINKLLPRVYAERRASMQLRVEMIRPVEAMRRPPKLPFVHYIPGLVMVKLAKSEIEVAVLEFNHGHSTVTCACTKDGKLYRHYKLYGADGSTQSEFWIPIHDLQRSNVSSTTLREIKSRLERIAPPVS